MADRYWVGGTATWDTTAGTKWATTSGGAGGASVPTSSDNVFFDAASGSVTCTIGGTGTRSAKSITCTGFTGTLAGSTNIQISGGITLDAGMGFTHTGTITIDQNATITTAGKTLGPLTVNYAGITVQLGDALTSSGAISVTVGTFTTNDYNVTATQLSSSNSNTRTINLGSSTVTLVANTTPINFSNATNLTFNAGTSTINSNNGTTQNFNLGADLTFYNISTSIGNLIFNGSATSVTINDLTVVAPSTAGVRSVLFGHNCVINGTLSTTGTAGNKRVWFYSGTYGVRRTLTVNSAPSLTDADFRDIIVNGSAAPISGTRIGNRGQCTGITFDAPKTVYWNLAGTQGWFADGWAATSGGTPNPSNFPLPQDTAVFNDAGAADTVSVGTATMGFPTVDMSARTSAMTFNFSGNLTCYGSWINGSGTSFIGTNTLTFEGQGTKTITTAGKTFTCPITINPYGGTVELADAFNSSASGITVTNGIFDTKNYNLLMSSGGLFSNNQNIRTIKLGSSTITASGNTPISFNPINLNFNAGTSQINCGGSTPVFSGGTGITFYNVSFTSTSPGVRAINNANTFNNLTIVSPTSPGLSEISLSANLTVTGTLTVNGGSAVRRIYVRSSGLGVTYTITANAISANDCDFRDITIAGSAAGASPTRAGDCGGNSGINFPAPKTVYWNRAASSAWTDDGWATSSGGTTAVNNCPLAQDTAVFDDAGAASTITSPALNIGSVNASARTNAMTLSYGNSSTYYGSYILGSGVTVSGTATQTFSGRGTQTFTSAGKSIPFRINVDSATGTLQLGDAFTSSSAPAVSLNLITGTFDAVTYAVTLSEFDSNNSNNRTLKMGSGLWTITRAGGSTPWQLGTTTNLTFFKGTADILLSSTATTGRTFAGGGLSYNKLTIGGNTSTSTTTITGNNQFTELASTKTVAHTIDFGSASQTFGKWSVTGSAGNVVTLTGTANTNFLAGSATSGIDYLAMGSIAFSTGSPAEFYAGANSTGTATAPVFRTATPASRTLYWVGGTGNWSDTARWSLSSGGAGGQAVPTSLDNVIFDSASNATAYTATIDVNSRCNQLTISGPASGNVTLAGIALLAVHGNVTLPATGLTRTYSGNIILSGSTIGKTFTTNGVTLANAITVNGVGCGWTLGSALNTSSGAFTTTNGSFDTGNYTVSCRNFISENSNSRTITLGSSTVDIDANGSLNFNNPTNLTFNSGTSQINLAIGNGGVFYGGGQLFYNVSFTNNSIVTLGIQGSNTFNNLTITGRQFTGIGIVTVSANQTITGTLTLSAGANAICRIFVRSDAIGTTRTLTCNAATATDIDFRDITIAGSAAPVSGTRLGDCGGNTGITFPAAKTVYVAPGFLNVNINNTIWATSIGGSPDVNNFPLAQDTAVAPSTAPNSGGTLTINAAYNIGTIDTSARTTNTMTLAASSVATVYGNWINGTGTTIINTQTQTFSGRGTMTFTSAGQTITFPIVVDTPTGTFQLGDAFNSSNTITHTRGTFDAVSYNLTCPNFASSNTNTRTLNMGSGLWTLTGTGTVWELLEPAGLTFNKGSANIVLSDTSTTARTFNGGNLPYNKLTIGGATGTSTLNLSGRNTFTELASTKTVAHTIAIGNFTIRVGAFTVTGTAGNVVTTTGAGSNLIYTGAGTITGLDYLNVQGRAYGPNDEITGIWNAGANSVNSGSLGWDFTAAPPPPAANANFFLLFA